MANTPELGTVLRLFKNNIKETYPYKWKGLGEGVRDCILEQEHSVGNVTIFVGERGDVRAIEVYDAGTAVKNRYNAIHLWILDAYWESHKEEAIKNRWDDVVQNRTSYPEIITKGRVILGIEEP